MSLWAFREPTLDEIRKTKARAKVSVREPPIDRTLGNRVDLTLAADSNFSSILNQSSKRSLNGLLRCKTSL